MAHTFTPRSPNTPRFVRVRGVSYWFNWLRVTVSTALIHHAIGVQVSPYTVGGPTLSQCAHGRNRETSPHKPN